MDNIQSQHVSILMIKPVSFAQLRLYKQTTST